MSALTDAYGSGAHHRPLVALHDGLPPRREAADAGLDAHRTPHTRAQAQTLVGGLAIHSLLHAHGRHGAHARTGRIPHRDVRHTPLALGDIADHGDAAPRVDHARLPPSAALFRPQSAHDRHSHSPPLLHRGGLRHAPRYSRKRPRRRDMPRGADYALRGRLHDRPVAHGRTYRRHGCGHTPQHMPPRHTQRLPLPPPSRRCSAITATTVLPHWPNRTNIP